MPILQSIDQHSIFHIRDLQHIINPKNVAVGLAHGNILRFRMDQFFLGVPSVILLEYQSPKHQSPGDCYTMAGQTCYVAPYPLLLTIVDEFFPSQRPE